MRAAMTRALPEMSDDEDDGTVAAASRRRAARLVECDKGKAAAQFTAPAGTKGFFYLIHLKDNNSEVKIAFPNKRDTDNSVPEGGVRRIPSRFGEPAQTEKEEMIKRWLYFIGEHEERETIYLVVSSARLEELPDVGPLPTNMSPLELKQANAIVARLKRHAPSALTRGLPTMDDDDDDAPGNDQDGALVMSVSRFMLYSVAAPGQQ